MIESRKSENDLWEAICDGVWPDHQFTKAFELVQARYVRLRVLEARNSPTISEFMIFPK